MAEINGRPVFTRKEGAGVLAMGVVMIGFGVLLVTFVQWHGETLRWFYMPILFGAGFVLLGLKQVLLPSARKLPPE